MAESNNATGVSETKPSFHGTTTKDEILQFAKKGTEELQKYLKKKCNGWRDTKITIGVVGESHSGKSSLINELRGLKPRDKGAAAVKNRECTKVPTPYEYPKNPLVTLWDLPGVGTNNFPQDTYMNDIEVSRFDFFLILSKDSFSQLDSWLASELLQRGKEFFFVRTFMDRALEEEQRDNDVVIKEKDEEGELTKEMETFMRGMKEYCAKELQFSNNEKVQIYLISNWYPEKFEFSKLVLAMSNHFSDIQREAFLFSTNMGTEEIYKAKKEILRKRIIYVALGSGVAGAVPIPGSGLLVDIPLIMREIQFYKTQFNLDATDLKTNERLAGILKSLPEIGSKAYVLTLVTKSLASEVMEETSKILSWVTLGLTSVLAGAASFGSTYYILTRELDKIADLSKQILNLRLESIMEKMKLQ